MTFHLEVDVEDVVARHLVADVPHCGNSQAPCLRASRGGMSDMADSEPFRYYRIGGDYWRTWGDDIVQFWDGDQWKRSLLPDRWAFLDDALGSGATVREVLDAGEVPGVHT